MIRRIAASALLIFFCGPLQAAGPADTLRSLEASGSTDPQAWRALAVEAREHGELELAANALAKAEEHGLPAVNAGFERARQHVVAGRTAAAVGALQAVVDGGFTVVAAITGDPVLGTLAGNSAYDALIDSLEVLAYPCEHQDEFRTFDFWLGDWDVHLANGTLAGTNRIESAERGCVLIEKWASGSGGSGHSINYLDHATGEWVQVWNDSSGSQISMRGGMTGDGMLLLGQIHYVSNGTTAPFRGLWTPLPDGRIRQFFEQSNDGGETWVPWFEGFYSRQSTSD